MQNSVEASTFVSEFTLMKNGVEIIEALRYKLSMFGVTIGGSTNIFCDNGEFCVNTTRPESKLSEKHHSIAYHRAQEAVAAVTVRVSKEHTSTNLDDLPNKMMSAPKREGQRENFTYREANWSMWFFYLSEGLPQAIDLFVSERTKL